MPAASPALQLALLQLAMQEQMPNAANGQSRVIGRPQSALALNAYVGAMPSAGDRDADYQRQRTDDRYAEDRELEARNHARLSDPIEAAKAAAEVRGFNTRRNVREDMQPMDFNEGNFGAVASHGAPKKITRTDQPTPRNIRSFTDAGASFTDPDAAMNAAQRTMLDPRVVASEIAAGGRNQAAQVKADDKAKADAAAQTKADENAQEIIRLATKLRDSDYMSANVGPLDQFMPTIRGGSREFQSDADRLRNLLALESRGQLKGQGAVSDFEGRMLASSATSLNSGLDEDSFKRELNRIIASKGGGKSSAKPGRQVGRFLIED